ncbi:Thymidine phosphorylase [Trichinella spiralis]|uniref:Thymidine phosphorylase n=1 Tax=Trichinella spiralis TaxID=6334 RepID=A0ABR3KKF5_TRISP
MAFPLAFYVRLQGKLAAIFEALMYCCVGPKAKKALFSLPLLTEYNTMTQSSWSNLFPLEEKERVVKRDERYPVLGVGPDPNGSFNVENFAFGKRFLPFNKKEIKLLLTKFFHRNYYRYYNSQLVIANRR